MFQHPLGQNTRGNDRQQDSGPKLVFYIKASSHKQNKQNKTPQKRFITDTYQETGTCLDSQPKAQATTSWKELTNGLEAS